MCKISFLHVIAVSSYVTITANNVAIADIEIIVAIRLIVIIAMMGMLK